MTDQKIEENEIEIWNTKVIEEADRDHGNLIDMKEGTFIKIVLIKICRPPSEPRKCPEVLNAIIIYIFAYRSRSRSRDRR